MPTPDQPSAPAPAVHLAELMRAPNRIDLKALDQAARGSTPLVPRQVAIGSARRDLKALVLRMARRFRKLKALVK
jgi:hypothetical protein